MKPALDVVAWFLSSLGCQHKESQHVHEQDICGIQNARILTVLSNLFTKEDDPTQTVDSSNILLRRACPDVIEGFDALCDLCV